ncbi:MAG TPA: GNAT family N-acetyltransferase [Ktedonosporobacter sp.]|nr:GNAT family N-acetyltransferase [Ktedonosporobacter sp.]
MSPIQIRPLIDGDSDWVANFVITHWGAATVIAHGVSYTPANLPGFVAIEQGKSEERERRVGLTTYMLQGDECEIVTIDSTQPGLGIGTALIEAVKGVAVRSACRRLWLITTNDNLNALRFYQKRGFTLAAIHKNALEQARKLKPQIPLLGNDGVPLRDEIELEMFLQ